MPGDELRVLDVKIGVAVAEREQIPVEHAGFGVDLAADRERRVESMSRDRAVSIAHSVVASLTTDAGLIDSSARCEPSFAVPCSQCHTRPMP